MEIADPTTFGLLAVKLGLVNQAQLNEALEEARDASQKSIPDLIFLTRALERKGYITNFQTSKILKGDQEGYFMGGYRILYKISSGSFGRVFRADDPRSGRVVAVKVLRRRWSEDQQRIDLFIREGKMGLTLKHPNIVEVLAINQDPVTRQYYIAMEFVEGGNLREIMQARKGPLTVSESLRFLEDMASGLAYAYSRGFTHRDLKLTNVLLSSDQQAKLVDFGLAQLVDVERDTRKGGSEEEQIDRTVDYAGLEKATGVKSGDVRSDIFFLGCIFFEILTGRAPLEMTKDRHARMARRRFEDVKTLKQGEIDAPPSVYQLCETMLSVDPRKRYQTPSQLLDTVRAARRDLAGPAGGDGAPGKPQTRSIFIAESSTRLQDAMREGFKKLGYRVLIASDPDRALDRFRQQPYDALVINAGTVGEDGLMVFDQVLKEAQAKRVKCAGVLLLSEEQADWTERVASRPNAAVLVQPVNFKQLHQALRQKMS